jgi:hypothetical protein
MKLLESDARHNMTNTSSDFTETYTFLEPLNSTVQTFIDPAFARLGYVPAGRMPSRRIIAKGILQRGNESYTVVREVVQAFNMSIIVGADGSFSISCLTPPRESVVDDETNGYAGLALQTADGPGVEVAEAVLYTADCPERGWIGRGSNCRRCPAGGYCPGGNRIWPIPGYFNFGEFTGAVYQCQPPEERCIGSKYSLCGEGYTGTLCSQCASNYYVQGGMCLRCEPGEALKMKLTIAIFCVVLNGLLFFAEQDFAVCLLNLIDKLKTFRAIGMICKSNLPSFIQDFYVKLALVTLDFELAQPGCDGTGSEFLAIAWYNSVLLLSVLAPTLVFMPMQMFVHGVLRSGIHKKNTSASDKFRFWKDRFVFSVLTFCGFATFMVTTLGFKAIFCVPLDGKWVLNEDPNVECGSSIGNWFVHLTGGTSVIVIALGFPLFVLRKVYIASGANLLHDERMHQKYGEFFGDFKQDTWRLYFFPVQHTIENTALSMIEVFAGYLPALQNIITIAVVVAYAVLLVVVRPFRKRPPMVTTFGIIFLNLYSVALSEFAKRSDGENATVVYAAAALNLALIVAFLTYTIFHDLKEPLWRPLTEKLHDRRKGAPICLFVSFNFIYLLMHPALQAIRPILVKHSSPTRSSSRVRKRSRTEGKANHVFPSF